MKKQILTGAGAAAMMMLSQAAQANTQVGSVVGAYDYNCTASSCAPTRPAGISHYGTYGNTFGTGDTPSLWIYNTTGSSFTNVQLLLTGYNGLNIGKTTVVTPGPIAPHTAFQIVWGPIYPTSPAAQGDLFAYDYDDEYPNTVGGGLGPVTPSSGGSPVCAAVGNGFCSNVGNFDVQFSALLGGNPISSNFSDNAIGQNGSPFGNVGQVFVPWEGVSPEGWSESFADNHTGTTPGTLADIFTGANQTGGTPAPEPATMALFGAGLGALGLTRRRRKA